MAEPWQGDAAWFITNNNDHKIAVVGGGAACSACGRSGTFCYLLLFLAKRILQPRNVAICAYKCHFGEELMVHAVLREVQKYFTITVGLIGTAALSLSACTVPERMQMAQPVYPCISDKGTVIGDKALIRVRNAEWAVRATRMGMDRLAPEMRAQMGENAYARPKATFLLVDLEVENISKSPIAWQSYGSSSKTYKLVSKDGITYNYENSLGDVNYTLGAANALNPGIAEVGRIVFDVPKGNYDFLITQTSLAGRTGMTTWVQEGQVFRCSLQLL